MALNVLIVDDSDVIRSMIGRTLALAQVPVGNLYGAANGQQALDVLAEEWIDLVLADLNMPVMDGAEMIERMRARPELADVPVIIVSTEGASQRIADLTDRGVSAWVRKPFTPEEIRDVVGRVTGALPDTEVSDERLAGVFASVLEQFAFIFPEQTDADEATWPGSALVAHVAFSGAATGSVRIAAPARLCTEVAANVLGIEVDDEMATLKAADTLGEVLNMTAGHLATDIEPDAHSDLHPPTVTTLDADAWQRMAEDPAASTFTVEGHPVILVARVRRARVGV